MRRACIADPVVAFNATHCVVVSWLMVRFRTARWTIRRREVEQQRGSYIQGRWKRPLAISTSIMDIGGAGCRRVGYSAYDASAEYLTPQAGMDPNAPLSAPC